ncbi:uncharacterized protein N7496_010622 [Penicillium cataractarum]|uniref:Uncharacterized protein n=1 Tax=Penicillium cataractarum TaxID=2100454 RepID=A0A9W9RTW2_9EURO|nr:uncharacterized protein N7496_010622 [Penicillium cataractarum]KAJ5364909.1 hypothetical protein N7496_010622 [Penicillium cataractarum]
MAPHSVSDCSQNGDLAITRSSSISSIHHLPEDREETTDARKSFNYTSEPLFNGNTTSPTAKELHQKESFDWNGSWIWEIGGSALGIISLALLVAFLAKIDGTAYDRWQYSISPNAVVSVITTIGKAAILVPVSACLSQLKWNRYRRANRLSDLQALDEASRGAWGSIVLFWSMRPNLATVGAVLTVLAVAIDSFSQQIIAIHSRNALALNGTAYVQMARGYELDPDEQKSPTMQIAVLSGLFQTNAALDPHCDSDYHCEYPEFVTLGICSKCEDVTRETNQTCKTSPETASLNYLGSGWDNMRTNCTYESPSGFVVNLADVSLSMNEGRTLTYLQAKSSIVPNTTITSVVGIESPLISILSLIDRSKTYYSHQNHTDAPNKPDITECAVYWCEQEFPTANTRYAYQPSKTEPLIPVDPVVTQGSVIRHDQPYLAAPSGLHTLSDNSSYPINYTTYSTLTSDLSTILTSDSDSATVFATQNLATRNITDILSSLATSMTDVIRSDEDTSITVAGKAYYSQNFIHVRWPWIILPVLVGVMSTVFLAITAVSSRKAVLWKTSLLPLLIGRLEVQPCHALSAVGRVDELSQKSKRLRVFLEHDPGLTFVEDTSSKR